MTCCRLSWLVAGAVLAMSGCGQRAVAYRFHSPLLGGPRLEAPPPDDADAADDALATADTSPEACAPTPPARGRDGAPAPGRRPALAEPFDDPGVATAASATTPAVALASGVVWTRLVAPHRAPKAPALDSLADVRDVAAARAVTGRRDVGDPLAWAWALARALGPGADLPAPASGAALVGWAEDSQRLRAVDAKLAVAVAPGDLLIFDRAVGGAPASLVAVALGHDARGVVEMLYLSGGVVRRGFLDPARPSQRRDHDGQILNTSLRTNDDWPPKGTHFLAGELLAHRVRL